ncbi:ketoacyl-synt-domain-containing protein [Melanomma pulvis-pyrius CBS 109.77]|uniref:Ketoacyl-synt-domain-containing protein n=1 Tax=Melanomma pulvis-pyrius CBS 109.77 TaxID=1314802 RepID=A0A6A6XEC3_9PLEO|nr:ketoacyl-synt-domain-containing protein [Melanomma pulvis-pyrius CBS 109.77]
MAIGTCSAESPGTYHARGEPIAIVGSSCRFPGGASSPSKLWDLLKNPQDVVQEIPPSRFSTEGFYHPDGQHHGSSNVRHAYLLDQDPRVFDRDFFGINPKEAASMDPQQRILLETVYEGVESAGYSIQQLRGSETAVYVGVMSLDYQFVAMRGLDTLPQYHATGGSMAILANRVSYFYDWRGPSAAIDTACSSSLVAMHQAVHALRSGEATMAVAAGANLILGPEPFISESSLNMLSPNGRSYMWDSAADGYTRGEGFSAVILKTLSQALTDDDHIECIIREIGVNSDGRTPGITMPSSDAQAALIRSTYARCGLDPTSERDRPQFFEAHGTGTPTGDPIEARTIQSVFFPDGLESGEENSELLVGSIKTLIGHTEGTAGLAGVMKASLAVQHGQIPANLHFRELNSRIQPFYRHLRVPTEMAPWPALPAGSPRRVSVNSFGFGGTNAHAIIESWDGLRFRDEGYATPSQPSPPKTPDSGLGGLFVLSANSGPALAARAASLVSYLQERPDTNLDRLSHTLFQRSSFPFRASFSATSTTQLIEKIEANMAALKGSSRIPTIPESLPPRILGVFTGQGAQWATMGKELYHTSEVFRSTMDQMQHSLNNLPDGDAPKWSLIDELSALKGSSRVGTASISQPLCTALQVALVNVLRVAGVEFAAVVGHSSGEIGAAYAAGYLSADNAIRIAYYRGFHSHLAHGPGGKRGKMMAVGMSLDQALRFCGEFGDALRVAASNSQGSCTLAGDAEAIEEAKSRLQEDGTFVRVLEVDTAYHSHHMQPCAEPYLESMRKCGIEVEKSPTRCVWYSSVWGSNGRIRSFDDADDLLLLKGQYWVKNLTQTVLFSQAVNRAVNEDQCFDLALEVGPHPALKGPSLDTIKSLTGLALPYTGVLRRGEGAVEAFCDALGLMWKSFPSLRPIINMRPAFLTDNSKKSITLKGLPVYPWDHDQIIWHESRASRIFRSQSQHRHELLGHPIVHGDRQRREVHWKQVLRLNEIPWLRGHRILDQFLFPATAYVTMAYEAGIRLVSEDQSLRLVELQDIEIHRPMNLEEDSEGLEILFVLRITTQTDKLIAADFACYSNPVDASNPEDALVPGTAQLTGSLKLLLGAPEEGALPPRITPQLPLGDIDLSAFYSSLSELGYGYTADFLAPSMLRRLNHAVVSVPHYAAPSLTRAEMHPATLDTAIHGIYAGVTSPGDGFLRAVYLPTRIDCVRVNMSTCRDSPALAADSFVTLADAKAIRGDTNIFNSVDGQTLVQVQGVHMMAVPGSHKRARQLYAAEIWERDASCGIDPKRQAAISETRHTIGSLAARLAFFYCRKLRDQVKPFEIKLMGKQRKNLMNWVLKDLLPKFEVGEHQEARQEWLTDSLDSLERSETDIHDSIDLEVIRTLGQKLPQFARGMAQPVRVLAKDDLLNRLYSDGFGFREANQDLGTLVGQLSHRYPRMKVLELGSGGGVTARHVLTSLEDRYASYACTDVSSETLPHEALEGYSAKVTLNVLDIEKDPQLQGHSEATFDLIIASNCLYAAQDAEEALRHCRWLLRPGGRLLLLEMTSDYLPVRLVKSLLPGSWLGEETPAIVDIDGWDALLRKAGFSGIDTSSSPAFVSVMLSEAVDSAVQFLRNPLSGTPQMLEQSSEFVLVRSPTCSASVAQLESQTRELLVSANQTRITSVVGLEGIKVPPGTSVLLLWDLDVPIFDQMDEERFFNLQEIVRTAGSILWVTSGATTGRTPHAAMSVGFGRSARVEFPELKLQILDVERPDAIEPSLLAKHLLQLAYQDRSELEEVLWTQEPELKLQEGALYIPRIRPLRNLNRLSSARALEVVTQSATVREAGTAIILEEQGDIVQAQVCYRRTTSRNQISLEVSASSLCSLSSRDGESAHLVIGRDTSSGQKLLAVSSTNGSTVTISESDVLHSWANEVVPDDSIQLHLILTALIAESVLEGAHSATWIHGAPATLGGVLELVASQHKINLYQTTSEIGHQDSVTFIHPYLTERDFQLVRPGNVRTFVSFELPGDESSLMRLVRTSLPNVKILRQSLTAASRDGITLGFSRTTLDQLIKKHTSNDSLKQKVSFDHVRKSIIGIHEFDISQFNNPSASINVINWNTTEKITARVLPPQHDGLFSSIKTYVLFGLSGDVGISICHWMVSHGARNIVLASRRPNVPRSVIEFMSRKGATVHTMAVDIGDRKALAATYADIEATMPPVGGVMNGGAEWRDRLFINMPWADFAAVLAPKVQGTEGLTHLLQEKKVELDFFILFSSVVAVAGNAGQTAYAAANLFMEGIVRERRRQGLAASIVHIGHLAGLGHVHRHDRRSDVENALHQSMDALSETDLHDLLAEAIIGGQPGSDRPAELIVGLKSGIQASWRQQPRLQHYLVSDDGDEDVEEGAGGRTSLKTQLDDAREDQDACLAILIVGFSAAVESMLHMKPGEADVSTSVANLGIDSLVAITMREWFQKEIGVDVSVIKVLSVNTSMTDLCKDVLASWRRLGDNVKA